jgi:hypothetical protein
MTSPRAIKTIRAYYNDPDSPESKRFFDWAAKQQGRKQSTVSQVQKGAGLDRAFVIAAMKSLQQLRFGKFTVGRRNKESRMSWDVDLSDLGRCAQGSDVDFDEPVTSHGTPQGPVVTDAGESHVFIMRPGLKILLPSDVTPDEGRQVSNWVLLVSKARTDRTDGGK